MNNPVHAIIFDLDGTLLDSITDIANCSNTILARWMCPTHPVARYAELVGDGLTNLARKVLPDGKNSTNDITTFIDEYRAEYSTRWNETSTHYDGIPDLLKELIARGLSLAVLSNKRDEFTKVCVSQYFPTIPFKEVRGERAGTPLKPDPTSALAIAAALGTKPQNCAFVGDSEIDAATASRAGMRFIGVLWGLRSKLTLQEAGCNEFISTPSELLTLV